MPSYKYNPYEDNQRATGGAQANGMAGAQTPQSVQNSGAQQKSGDPYSAFGSLGQAWANVIGKPHGQSPAPTTTSQPPDWFQTYTEHAMGGGMYSSPTSSAFNDGPGGGGEFPDPYPEQPFPQPPPTDVNPPPVTPPPVNPPPVVPPPVQDRIPPPGPGDYTESGPTTPYDPTGGYTESSGPTPYTPAPRQKPPNVTDQTWGIAQRWVQQAAERGGDYSWLLDKPEAVDDYTREAFDLEKLGITGLHFTDWARARGYSSPIDSGTLRAPAQFKQMGGDDQTYEKMVGWLADGSSRFGADAMRPYAETIQRAPGLLTAYEIDKQQAEQNGFYNIDFVDWLANQDGGFNSPLAGQAGQDSADAAFAWKRFRLTGSPDPEPQPMYPGGMPPAPPGFIAPPGTLGGPPATTPPPQTAPPPTAPPPTTTPNEPPVTTQPADHVPAAPASNPPSAESYIPKDFDPTVLRAANVDYLDPVYQDAMDEVRRQMMQSGAVSGSLNSGGFGSSLAHSLSPIANQFAQQKGQLQFQAQQANADRILDKYKFDRAEDLQKFLAANKDQLDRYGIDQNVILQKWITENRAQLEREGYDVQKWIANLNAQTGLEGARLSAGAAGAAASASADAARYNADLDYRLGMSRLGYDFYNSDQNRALDYWNQSQNRDYENTYNQRGYDLGVLGINRDIYGMDQSQLRYLMDLMYRQSPDSRLGAVDLPGMFPYGGN